MITFGATYDNEPPPLSSDCALWESFISSIHHVLHAGSCQSSHSGSYNSTVGPGMVVKLEKHTFGMQYRYRRHEVGNVHFETAV